MPGKRSKVDDASKLSVLTVIREKKDILFGIFTTELENGMKKNAWKEVLMKAQSIGVCNSSRSWEFVRDSVWGNWKSRTLEKRDNAKKTGRGGGKQAILTPVDDMILDIIGRDTPNVVGLNIPQTGDTCENTSDAATSGGTQDEFPVAISTPQIPATIDLSGHENVGQTRSRKSNDSDVLRRKRKLQLELLEVEIYHRKLLCLSFERSLRIQPSCYTKCFISTGPISPMITQSNAPNWGNSVSSINHKNVS